MGIRIWTDDDIKVLRTSYEIGVTVSNISISLGRTERAVRNKAYKLKITNPNRISDEVKKYVIDNYKSYNVSDVAEHIGMNKANVSRLAKQLGIARTGRKVETLAPKRVGAWHPKGWIKPTEEEHRRRLSEAQKLKIKKYGHPRGMLGKHHSEEFSKNMSERVKLAWKDPNSKMNSEEYRQQLSDNQSKRMTDRIRLSPNSIYSRTQKGWADIGDKHYYFKSGWELKYANYLETLRKGNAIMDWEYEPDTFWFEAIRRGVRSYTPDFKLFFDDSTIQYHEVKGWMDAKSKTKIKRMAKYYPDISLTVIDQPVMKQLGLI